MLNSSAAAREASVRRSAFLQTCNLLSQYVKDKKALADLTFGNLPAQAQDSENSFGGKTMNLFPVGERAEQLPDSGNAKSMSLFPQHAIFTAPKPASSGPQYAPMTIFYGGHVMVFNDFPAHKAKKIMELASQGISHNPSTTAPVVESASLALPSLNVFPTNFSSNNTNKMQEPAHQTGLPIINDLPIARKASLHRFLEKRKDRIIAKAPYDKTKLGSSDSKVNESNPWLGLAAATAAAALPSVQP